MREKLQSKCQEGLQVTIFATKGRGVKTTRCFKAKEFLVEYAGELLTYKKAVAGNRLMSKAMSSAASCFSSSTKPTNIVSTRPKKQDTMVGS